VADSALPVVRLCSRNTRVSDRAHTHPNPNEVHVQSPLKSSQLVLSHLAIIGHEENIKNDGRSLFADRFDYRDGFLDRYQRLLTVA